MHGRPAVLMCSRCGTTPPWHLLSCRENAYQCRQCRHINYEAPDAFICSECGHSRYGRFELLLQATKVPGCPAALAAAGSEDALAALDATAAAAALKASALQQAAAAVQQQAAALATSDFHHTPEAAAAAAAAGSSSSGGAAKRGSSGPGSSSPELLLKPGLRHLAELYAQRCKPAYEDALQAARAHAAVRSAIAQAEPASSSSSDGARAGSGELSFSSCSYGHISAVLSAAVSLLRGVLAVAPSSLTHAARATQAVPTLLAMLQPAGSLPGAASRAIGATGLVHGSALAGDIRSLLLGLAKADGPLHEELLLLLQQSLLPGLGLSSPAEGQMAGTAGMEQQAAGLPSSSSRSPFRVLSGHELQLLLMLAQQEAHQVPKQAAATAGPHAGAVRLVLLLLQQAVQEGCTHGLSPELLLLPGLKVMAGAAAAQQQLARSAAAEANSAAMAAAAAAATPANAAGTPSPAVPGEQVAASADAALDLEVSLSEAASGLVPTAAAAAPAAAAAGGGGGGPNVDDTHPADSILDDAEAEQLEQLKIAEYLSRKGSAGPHQPGLPRAAHSAPAYMQQQQQQQQRLQPRQRLQPLGYGQSPFVGQQQQQQPAQNASSGDLQQTGGLRVAAQSHHGPQQQASAAAAAINEPRTAAPAAAQAGAGAGSQEQQDSAGPRVAVEAGSGMLPLQELMLIAQELVLHPHSIAVRKEAAALLLQLQPEPLKRLQQLQQLVTGACRVTAQAAPGAPAAGTELFALLMETVAELLVQCSKHGSSAGGTQPAAAHAQQEQRDSGAGGNSPKSAAAGDASVAHAAVSVAAVHPALHGLLRVCCQGLTQQIAGLLQQEQQLVTQRSTEPAASAAALPLLLEQIDQLLIGLAQLHHDHHHHHHGHHGHHHQQQQQQEEHQDQPMQQQQQRTDGHNWVEQPCLRQLLWSVGGLDALTAMRTAVTQSAAQQLHRLLRQGWLEGGDASGTTGGSGISGDSDSAAEDEDYTEADEYETEDEDEEEYTDYDEGDAGGDGDEHTEQHAAAAAGRGLLSGLPALSEAVLLQRRSQLVEALVQVLAGELQRFDQQQLQQRGEQALAVGPPPNAQAAGRSAAQLTAAEASLIPAELSWRSSLGVCSALVVLLSAAVSPEKPPPSYQLLLEKAATQEEFIPGQLPSGGLVSSAVLAAAAGSGQDGCEGPLMRDVKNYICRRLDMTGKGCLAVACRPLAGTYGQQRASALKGTHKQQQW